MDRLTPFISKLIGNPKEERQLIRQQKVGFLMLFEISPETNSKEYPEALEMLFEEVQKYQQKESELLVMSLAGCVSLMWDTIYQKMLHSTHLLSRIDGIDFSDSSLTLKRLEDLYEVYKACIGEQGICPKFSIGMTPALLEISEDFVNRLKVKGKTSQNFIKKLYISDDMTIPDLIEINKSRVL